MSGPNILLLDIETAPHRVYTWGLWSQDIALNQIEEPGYTLCWAAKWYGSSSYEPIMFSSVYHDGKQEMLEAAHRWIDAADAVIHYNGTKFDMPILNQEFLAAGLKPPSPVIQIDLLNTVKKRFRLPSNKLDYLARYLGLKGKMKHKGMQLWRDCMAGDAEAWETMKQYNIQDIRTLEHVYEYLLPWISNHPNHALFTEQETHVCPNCGSNHLHKRGSYYTKTLTYQRWQCQDCGAWSRSRTTNTPKEKRANTLVGVA